MAFNISEFRKQGLASGGVRPSLFEVVISPGIGEDTATLTKFTFTCEASEIRALAIQEGQGQTGKEPEESGSQGRFQRCPEGTEIDQGGCPAGAPGNVLPANRPAVASG